MKKFRFSFRYSHISDPNCILMYRRILRQSRASNVNIQEVSPRQEVVQALETWRSETEGTYKQVQRLHWEKPSGEWNLTTVTV